MEEVVIEEIKSNSSQEYLKILEAVKELPFNVGKNLLADFLSGDYKNKSIIKNRLDDLNGFDALNWRKDKILSEIDKLVKLGMIEFVTSDYNRFIKVLRITAKGRKEISNPTILEVKEKTEHHKTEISEGEEKRFEELKEFLEGYNNNQKKAIISEAKKILCVAGAGSGKTTVLTKRIEFLVKYKGVNPSNILAITFTRKAKAEMERRLEKYGITGVRVNTFNSFCEGILQKNGREIYGRPIRVQNYSDKILAMNMALASIGMDIDEAINNYFSPVQQKFKTKVQLQNSFMNDCFSVMEYLKVTGTENYDFSKDAQGPDKQNAYMIYRIVKYLKEHMEIQGLRDYTDQLLDAVSFLKKSPLSVPQFEHVLVDEYQDVNSTQIELLKILNPNNLFAVGDPRQSIFGWRGCEIRYVLEFGKEKDAQVISLDKNYRSAPLIVQFMNHAIKDLDLPNLESCVNYEESRIAILDFESEEGERRFVLNKILESSTPREEIFVLARTNRQLFELSEIFAKNNIAHIVKTDEVMKPVTSKVGEVTLATIHAIKGLEAREVFVIGCNEANFPCKASDHPAVEMIKTDSYDKIEEEKRLFYVAISRAREKLYLTYSGKKPTYFITDEMMALTRNV